jgi:GrpB-like predicted nucleotidyltransferase (UPF0157 family)
MRKHMRKRSTVDEVVIVEYDLRWPALFDEEAARIRAAVSGDLIERIEHIGSTAVPGLPAKPIIDILIGVESVDEAREQAVPVLESLGYSFWADNPHKDVLFLVKGLPPNGPRTHHIRVVALDAPSWDTLLFRDYLRAHPDESARYAQLKRDLAARFQTDREAYTEAKTDYVKAVTERAKTGSIR